MGGHPDKLCDQVSDAVLDTCLKEDPKSKVACETATKDNMVMVAGEITTQAKIDYEAVVRGVVAKIGFDSFVDDLSSVDSKGLSDKTCEVIVRINKQSPDIAGGVHVGKDDMDVGAGDQGIMFGYASDETADCMPLTHSMATRLGKTLTDVRQSGELWWLRPDGKTQVTIQYQQKKDGSVEPQKIHTVVISTQHAEPLKATRKKEVAGYTGADETAPSMEDMNKQIVERVVKRTLSEIKLKNGKAALPLFSDADTHLYINPLQCPLPCASLSTRRQRLTATSDALPTLRMASNSSNGRTPKTFPSTHPWIPLKFLQRWRAAITLQSGSIKQFVSFCDR